MIHGQWIEQLEAIAVSREVIAVAGARELADAATARSGIHFFPISRLEGRGSLWTQAVTGPVRALAFAGDELLLSGGDDGALCAWDVTGHKRLAHVSLGAAVRAIAVDAAVARGAAGVIAVGTADGALHVVAFDIRDATPSFGAPVRHALSDGAISAVAIDPSGLVVAGGMDGKLSIVAGKDVRGVSPGGDGGIRALACIGDGRVAIGCGDGSLRLCFLVGDVEATDRSGDHGHDGAIRALALAPVVVDDAGREQPRRIYSAGEDKVIKSWLVDGSRRPKTIEPGAGPITAMVGGAPKLWVATSDRTVAAITDGDAPKIEKAVGAFAENESILRDPKAATKVKIATIEEVRPHGEVRGRELLELGLTQNGEVTIAALQAIASSARTASRPAVRSALGRNEPEVRKAAFAALVALDPQQPLAALRVGVAASHEDIRVLAVDALAPHAKQSVVAFGLVADALRDSSPNVRRRALAVLRQVSGDVEAARTALVRGTADIRAEALLVLGFALRPPYSAETRALALTALDDPDPGVGAAAFLTAVAHQPRLAARLASVVPGFEQAAQQVNRVLSLPADDGGPLSDDELEPLFAALACRNAAAAVRGAGALVALRDSRASGAVLQLTREQDPALRRAATRNLIAAATLWPEDDRLGARLAWLLDDVDLEVRTLAFDRLAVAMQPLDLAELALRTSQEDIRVRALQILVRAGAGDARADALLGDALDDEAAKVRGEAFRTLWAWHAADPRVPIQRGAASRHADLRLQVVRELDTRNRANTATPEMYRTLTALIGDPVASVGHAAFEARIGPPDAAKSDVLPAAEVALAAMSSPVPSVRAAGARSAKDSANPASLRARLVQLVADDRPEVHQAAIEGLDAVAPGDAEGFAVALSSIFYELRVRAAELCAARRDPKAIGAMQKLLVLPVTDVNRPSDAIRHRAARAIADVGDVGSLAFLLVLVGDDDPIVREMGARGIAAAAQPDHSPSLGALAALLVHDDLPVRSWGGEGLAKLGDLRALPVLAGTQRHDHRPLRAGAIVGFVALGGDGVRGLRQGLEDRDREIQDLAFAVIVARDVAMAQAGIAPDLLVDAMSSPSPEIRFAAARLVERRAAGETLPPEVIAELVGPRQPEKAGDMHDWPNLQRRAAILQVLADAIASDEPPRRYAAAQVLALRPTPLAFWREAARLVGPGRVTAPAMGGTTTFEKRTSRRSGWLRRLAGKRDTEESTLEALARMFVGAGRGVSDGLAAAQRLVFGVYAGLVRQAPAPGDADETHRVRRDAVGRLVELAREDAVGADVVLPVLGHALTDPHHLVRDAALTALRSLYPPGALAPLRQAIAGAADIGKAAIDELVEIAQGGDDRAAAMVRAALDADSSEVRRHAAQRLPKLYPAGSTEPLLLAAASRYGDVRLGAINELAAAKQFTASIRDALVAALASEHVDLRLRAAVALATKGEATGVDTLAGFLRSEEHWRTALDALVEAGGGPAAEAIAARLDDNADGTLDPSFLFQALGKLGNPLGAPAIVRHLLAKDVTGWELPALADIFRDRAVKPQQLPDGGTRARYRETLALGSLADAMKCGLPAVREGVAKLLGDFDERGAEDLLAKLLGDREPTVRMAAAEALALRAQYVPGATLSALDAALRGGRRELVLASAIGLASRKRPEAFQPLVLVVKAGEPAEQERAVVWLGALGDVRALDVLRPLLQPGVDATDLERALQPAATEAIARMLPALTGDAATELRERIERIALAGTGAARTRALIGLRHAGDARSIEVLAQVAGDAEADVGSRVVAMRQLGLAGTHEALLADLLNDSDWTIRAEANLALERVLAGDRTKLAMYGLGSFHDQISGPAARYLASEGDPATLVARLGTVKNPETRRMLREGLARRGAAPAAELEVALRSGDVGPRTEAAWLSAGTPALKDAVAAAASTAAQRWAKDKQPDEAEAWRAALWAATRLGFQLDKSVMDGAPDIVRRVAVYGVRDEAALAARLDDGDREVRAVAAKKLASSMSDGAAAAALNRLGARADATTVGPLAKVAWPRMAAGLFAKDDTRSWAVLVSLEQRTVAEVVAIAGAKGKDKGRLAAIALLGRLGGEAAKSALERIHSDKAEEDAVKLAAWKSLKRLLRGEERAARTYDAVEETGGGDDDGDTESDLPAEDGEQEEEEYWDEDEDDDGGDDDDE